MKNKLPLFKIFSLVICSTLLLLVFGIGDVNAQEGISLRISPPILEIEVEPGNTYSDYIKVENLNEFESVTLYPQVVSFVAKGDEGGQEFIEDSEETTSYSLAQWMNISTDTLEIEPLERVVLPFTINIPLDAEPGGRYGAVLLGNQPTTAEDLANSVALGAKSGTIILARIAGDITESAKINTFSINKDFYNYPPVDFEVVVENTGNVHVKPLGTIEISNIFGKVVDEVTVNEGLGNVLPDSTRKFSSTWDREGFTLGRYKAALNLKYGDQTESYMTDMLTFWVVPVKEVAIGLAVLVIIILLIIFFVKSYNKMIVKKAMEMQQNNQNNPPSGGQSNTPTHSQSTAPPQEPPQS
jgi:hypothetical protein